MSGKCAVAISVLSLCLAHTGFSEIVGTGGTESIRLRKLRALPDFNLIDTNGDRFGLKDLEGKVWVADFIFTRCAGPCLLLTQKMGELQKLLPKSIQLVTVTVDPEFDTPEVLGKYADEYGAQKTRWHFLTGEKETVLNTISKGFALSAPDGSDFHHTQRMVLVDGDGAVRGYYDGDNDASLKALRVDAYSLLGRSPPILPLYVLPPLNACLNATCFALLLIGFLLVKKRKLTAHKVVMLVAFGTSMLFLFFYLYYHSYQGSTGFQGTGTIRTVYLTILLTHSLLAAAVPFLAIITIYRGLKDQLPKHARIARWTLPIWLYVSVTGVVIYWMLYQM